MKRKSLLLMLLLAFAMPWAAMAQTTVFEETFGLSSIPSGWTQDASDSPQWTMSNDNSYGMGSSDYAAKLSDSDSNDSKRKLITPSINLSSYASNYRVELSFDHRQVKWSSDQDQLRVYYRTSNNSTWVELASYTSEVSTVTNQKITLPAAACTSTCQIAFEGNAKWGHGVFVDDVYVKAYEPTIYTINSTSDWNTFRTNVENGTNYDIVKLNADISVSTMVGTDSKPFRGTFDGNNHTIEVNYTSTGERCAPFPTVANATFKDLTITGTISTSHTQTGGFVGYVGGNNGCSFTNCVSDVDITSSCTGTTSQGGFVGQMDRNANPTATFTGCAFTGSFEGSYCWGGFVGWNEGYASWANGNHSTVTLTNCVFAPRSITDVVTSDCATFARSTSSHTSYVTFTNCYYTQALGTAQGKQAYSVTLVANPTAGGTVSLGTSTDTYSVSGITAYSTGIKYNNTFYAGSGDQISVTATANAGYSFSQWNGGSTSNPYSYTMTDNNASLTANFKLNIPHTIASVEDWDAFCAAVNSGHNYSGETVTLMNDISGVTTMANSNKNFEGTFDGNKHTIEVNYTSTGERCAPFPTVANATFKDLTITGTISTSHTNTGGFVGYVAGNNGCSFTNCVSDVDITSSCTGTTSQGGFVGLMDRGSKPTATFTGCAFTGSFEGSYCWGGFVGWNEGQVGWSSDYSTVTLTNCVFAPRSITNVGNNCATFARSYENHTSYVEFTNCYYTQALGTAQGKQAYSVTGVSPVTVERSGSASNTYNVSGIAAYNPGLNFTNNGVTIIYAGNNDNITLNLGYTGEGTVNQYTHNGIAFTDDSNPYSLTMPNENVVIAVANISFTKEIEAYGTSERGGYYLIASPVGTEVTPSADNGFLSGTYDLYYFDQNAWDIVDNESVLLEWRNYDVEHFSIASGTGYLYANKEGTTLTFTGTPYSGNGEVSLSKIEGPRFSGWNLVGNPFAQTAYFTNDFYTLNADRNEVVAGTTKSVEAMEGIFVVAANDGETMTFSTTPLGKSNSQMSINVVRNRGNVIDRAIVRFDEESLLPKFQLNPDHTKVYIPMEGKDYAVVYADGAGTMPVNFKAEENGHYTLNFTTENVNFNYLHLIDNRNGNDVDLLQTPYYAFDAKSTDFASRFTLVFATGNDNDDTFAFFNNGVWIINNDGDATLQVVDALGRMLSSESISGSTSKAINVATGVYMLRLINGDKVKVQKIVVKR